MNQKLNLIIEESINLEQNIANLYKLFAESFSEDFAFWEQLSHEENNHAELIKTARNVLLECDEFPEEILACSLEELQESNDKINHLISKYSDAALTRNEAFNMALTLEQSAGEIHYQNAMSKDQGSDYIKIFQQLNLDDKDHAQRISAYMDSKTV